MKAYVFLFTILVVFVVVQETRAQYDEICHWQCDVIHCDYYGEYCDYDCYEVCYPWAAARQRRQVTLGLPTSGQHQKPQQARKDVPMLSVKGGTQSTAQATKTQEAGSTGKTVRMRIENPTFQSVHRGRVVGKRVQNSRSFALMQTCLSDQVEKKSVVSSTTGNIGTKHDDSVLLQPFA